MKKLNLIYLIFIFNIILVHSQENDFNFKSNFTFYKITEFKEGMRFMVSPNEYYILNFRDFKLYEKKGRGVDADLKMGEIYTFKRYEYRKSKDFDGNNIFVVVLIFDKDGVEYEMSTEVELKELTEEKHFKYVKNFLFYEDVIKARELLLNKEFYLMKYLSYCDAKTNTPYTIINVEPNKTDTPIKITFKNAETGEIFSAEFRTNGTNELPDYRDVNKYKYNNFDDYFITKKAYDEIENQKRIEKEKERLKEEEKEKLANNARLEKERLAWIEIKSKCHYSENGFDEFDKVNKKITERYNLNEIDFFKGEIRIQLEKTGNTKYIWFFTYFDLGCASSYSNDQSYIKVKLENGDILTFYHIGDIDCGDFTLVSRLTENEIIRLKKSPIKSFRLSGTKYSNDIVGIKWTTFFQDKLDCIK